MTNPTNTTGAAELLRLVMEGMEFGHVAAQEVDGKSPGKRSVPFASWTPPMAGAQSRNIQRRVGARQHDVRGLVEQGFTRRSQRRDAS